MILSWNPRSIQRDDDIRGRWFDNQVIYMSSSEKPILGSNNKKQGITNTLALPIENMLYIYLLWTTK
jgi:hypothetical protein